MGEVKCSGSPSVKNERRQNPMQRSPLLVGLIFLIFFVISLLTNILNPIIPDLINSFHLSLTAAAFLPFAFFVAYGVMSIPAGMLIEAFKEKPVILTSFWVGLGGALCFALFPVYAVALPALFVIGLGMAMLQVAINPLLRVAGGEEHYAFYSTFAQVIFGAASFISPQIYSYLVQNLSQQVSHQNWFVALLRRVVPAQLPWVSIYWVFSLVTLLMVAVIYLFRFPAVERTADEQVGTWETHRVLFNKPVVWLFFLSIFAYVGSEQGTANWISQFLSTYHHFNPQTTGADAVSWFWGLMTVGCLLGMGLLKLFDSRRVLIGFALAAVLCLSVGLFGPAQASLVAFPLMGFFLSVMWPITFSLALNSVAEHHGSFSGILCTAIVGGAVVPLIIGRIGDYMGLRTGMMFLYLTLGWILAVGFWARPLIANETLQSKKQKIAAGV
jgi:FHS family L-fucose permease-like MFS transporter